MGVCNPTSAIRVCRSSPLSPGSCKSNTRQLGASVEGRARNSCAEAKVSAFHPADRISRWSPCRTEGSSSTIAMIVSGSCDCRISFCSVVPRKGKMETCLWAVLRRSPQSAPMGLKNGTANGEPHAHAAGLRGIERVKDLVPCVRVKTYARIFNRSLHVVCINIPSHDDQFSRPLIYTAHRFDRIHDQV